MAATYKQFLASPSSAPLADNASLHYIPTTLSFSGPTEIIKHLNVLQKQVKKKKEDVLNVVEGETAAVFEIETGLEFVTSGGAYLPGLDDNFLTDRVAYLPITHVVSFAADGKINQIRLQWDQGALLKQLDIIGKSGRNWPIKDNREQITLLQTCVKAVGAGIALPSHSRNDSIHRARGNSTHALRDPHASLHMMQSREEIESEEMASVVSPFAGKRPTQRSFTEILGDEPEGEESPSVNRHSMISPAKSGGGKNYQPMRIFDAEQEAAQAEEDTPKGRPSSSYIKPNPRKFQHFDFADGSDPQDAPAAGVAIDDQAKSKHNSQWSFEDFVTPSKPKPSRTIRHNDVRHWDTDRAALGETPAQPAGKGRRDAESHFELQDDGERVVQPDRGGVRPKGSMHNDGLGLYKDRTLAQEDGTPEPKKALGNITNLNHRGKDFDPHFTMTDAPSPSETPKNQHIPEARQKAVKMMDANWSAYDKSPQQKENQEKATKPSGDSGIHIAGDGMGGRKGTNRNWLYGEGDEEEAPKAPTTRRGGGPTAQQRSFWDF